MFIDPLRIVLLAVSFVVLGCGASHGDARAQYADAARNDLAPARS